MTYDWEAKITRAQLDAIQLILGKKFTLWGIGVERNGIAEGAWIPALMPTGAVSHSDVLRDINYDLDEIYNLSCSMRY